MKSPRHWRSALARRFLFLFACLAFFAVASSAAASPFYTYTIVARTGVDLGGSGFVANSISPAVSLNDNGHVAFIAQSANGRKAAFVAEPSGNAFVVRKLAETSSGDYGSVWVNCDYYLTAQSQYPATKDPSAVLPQQVFGFLPDFKPVIVNSGEIVAHVGNHDDSPNLLYPPGLGTPQPIAGLASFSKIGQCPGLSDDGQVVAFYGELKPDRTKQITRQNGDAVPVSIILEPSVQAA
jgi:hypothetical protein